MIDHHEETMLRAAFAPARELEPGGGEVARVLARVQAEPARAIWFDPAGGWRRLAAPALAALVLLIGGLYAVPTTRAAIEDAVASAAEAFTGYSRGEEADAPGRPLRTNEPAPEYFGDSYRGRPFARDPRVLAEAGGYKLYAYRAPEGSLSFDLGDTGVGMGFEGPEELGRNAIVILGPGAMQYADAKGHVPLFGLVADNVTSVELSYDSGPSLRVDDVAGGFVLLVEPDRGPREMVVFDAAGDQVEAQRVDYPGSEWQRYVRPPGDG
jgi:hypothetical protein